MRLDVYQEEANRTGYQTKLALPTEESKQNAAVLALGLGGEAGEVQEILKKWLGHGHHLDREKLKKELGDVLWYLSSLATWAGLSLDDVASANLGKLRARYPDGFSHEASKNRVDT